MLIVRISVPFHCSSELLSLSSIGPLQYVAATNSRKTATPFNHSRLGSSSRRVSEVDFDAIPSPPQRTQKSMQNGHNSRQSMSRSSYRSPEPSYADNLDNLSNGNGLNDDYDQDNLQSPGETSFQKMNQDEDEDEDQQPEDEELPTRPVVSPPKKAYGKRRADVADNPSPSKKPNSKRRSRDDDDDAGVEDAISNGLDDLDQLPMSDDENQEEQEAPPVKKKAKVAAAEKSKKPDSQKVVVQKRKPRKENDGMFCAICFDRLLTDFSCRRSSA